MPVGIRFLLLTSTVLFLGFLSAHAQNEDCQTAEVICSDDTFSTNPMGAGIDDFDNPNNDPGCLQIGANSPIVEDNVDWYYFEFREDMPPGLTIEFTIDPVDQAADYDFAIWGPDLACDSLGEPVRCSFAFPACTFCPLTGLGMGQTHISEDFTLIVESDPTSGPSTGFVAPMVVNPGEGFFLMVNNFQNTQQGFSLSWGGPAAPFLNCIANPNCPIATAEIRPDTTVCAGTSFPLTATITNWNGGQSYFWSGEAPDTNFLSDTGVLEPVLDIPADFSGTLTYALLVKEGACEKMDTITITVDAAPVPALPADTTLCPGGSLTLDGGPGFGSYAWSTGETTRTIGITAPGTYELTVTSPGFACSGEAAVQVAEAAFPDPLISGPTGFCRDSTVVLNAGPGFAAYLWSDGSTGQTLAVNAAGAYAVTVTDDLGCTAADTLQVSTLPGPDPLILPDGNLCQGDTVRLDAGGPFASYLWSGGETDASIRVSMAGDYAVTVTDANGCPGSDTLSLALLPLPQPVIDGDAAACADTFSLLSVQPFDSIFWSTGAGDTTQIVVQAPGTYAVEVVDANGCRGADSLDFAVLPVPAVQISGPSSLCNGDSVVLDAGPGYASYLWSPNGESTQTIVADSAGAYAVTVTNSQGCDSDTIFNLFNLPPNPVLITVGDASFCEGDSLRLNATSPNVVSYQWNTGDTTPVLVVDQPGTYTVTGQDTNQCLTTASLDVGEDPLPDPQIQGTLAFCPGDSSQLSVANGPYDEYRWQDGSTFNTFWADTAEQLIVTVTDTNGCTASDTAATSLYALTPFTLTGDTAFCIGSATILGVQPGTFAGYLWSTGATTPQVTVDTPGPVSLTVTDANGCTQSQSIEVGYADPAILPDLPPAGLCPGDSLRLYPGPFAQYQWSDLSTDSAIWITEAGNYGVTVTDVSGCVYDTSVNIAGLDSVPAHIQGLTALCAGPNGTFDTEELTAMPEGDFTYQWSTGDTSRQIRISQGGDYGLTVTSSAGCTGTDLISVREVPVPEPEITGDSLVCTGKCATLEVLGDFDNYSWATGPTTPSITVCTPGVYEVRVEKDGCSAQRSAVVERAPDPSPQLTPAGPLCLGDTLEVRTTEPYAAYQWSNGAQTPAINVTRGGPISVEVTDFLGCTGMANLDLTEVSAPEPVIVGDPYFCPGDSVVLQLDRAYDSVRWSTGAGLDAIVLAEPDSVAVEVVDSNGCTGTAGLLAAELPAPDVVGAGDSLFCTGGTATLEIVPPTVQHIGWSNGATGPVLTVDAPGLYTATATNIFGCSLQVPFEVEEVSPPEVDAGADARLDCRTAAVQLGGPGQDTHGSVEFFWQGPGIDSTSAGLPNPEVDLPGLYTLYVEHSAAGCRSPRDSVRVEDVRYVPAASATRIGLLSCTQPTVTLDGTGSEQGPGIVYQWLDPQGVPIPGATGLVQAVGGPGTHVLEVRDTALGCVGRAEVEVPADPDRPDVEAGQPRFLTCLRDAVRLQGSADAKGGPAEVGWSSSDGHILAGAGSLAPTVDRPGWYVLRLTRLSDGCTVVDSVRVGEDREPPLAVAAVSDSLGCLVEEVELDGSASMVDGPATFDWYRLADGALAASGQTGLVSQPGPYELIVTQLGNGCQGQDTVEVLVGSDAPGGLRLDARPPVCLGTATGTLTAQNVSGGLPPYLFSLNGSPFSPENTFTNLPAGTYRVDVQDAAGCTTRLTATLPPGGEVTADLGPDVELQAGDSYTVQLSTNLGAGEIGLTQLFVNDSLACENCSSLALTPETDLLVRAWVEDTAGCPGQALMQIRVDNEIDIYVPNAFSPNGDGANDRFLFFTNEPVQMVTAFRIFNRWGGLVFEEENFPAGAREFGWDGTHRGKPLNAGVYVYLIRLVLASGEEVVLSGDVTLMR